MFTLPKIDQWETLASAPMFFGLVPLVFEFFLAFRHKISQAYLVLSLSLSDLELPISPRTSGSLLDNGI